jgi:hypothetical protein
MAVRNNRQVVKKTTSPKAKRRPKKQSETTTKAEPPKPETEAISIAVDPTAELNPTIEETEEVRAAREQVQVAERALADARRKAAARETLKRLATDPLCAVTDVEGKLRYADAAWEVANAEQDLDQYETLPGLHWLAGFFMYRVNESVEWLYDNLFVSFEEPELPLPPAAKDLSIALDELRFATEELEIVRVAVEDMKAMIEASAVAQQAKDDAGLAA